MYARRQQKYVRQGDGNEMPFKVWNRDKEANIRAKVEEEEEEVEDEK